MFISSVGKFKFVKGSDIKIDNFIGFIECDVYNNNEKLNFLPYRDEKRDLISPYGK